MFELPEIIVEWIDNNNYPPIHSSLPPQLLLPGLFCENVRFWLMQSEVQQREYGSLIYLQRMPVAQLVLGDIIKGERRRVDIPVLHPKNYSWPGHCFLGLFHTHPESDPIFSAFDPIFSAPSFQDFTTAYHTCKMYNAVCYLVVSPPRENPWYYLIIGTKDTSLCRMDETILTACSEAIRLQQIKTVTKSIKKEMSHYTNDPSVDPNVCNQIAHDRTLSHVSTLYKAGFYSGQNGFLILRNTIS